MDHWTISLVDGKHVSGDFQLSGVRTEVVLASFSVLPAGARFDLTLTTPTMYENELPVRLHAYRDTEWNAFLKEPLCSNKIRLAKLTHAVAFQLDERSKLYMANVTMEISNIRRTANDPIETKLKEEEPRNHYWYFVIDDCSLEQYFHDTAIPKVHYELDIRCYQGRFRQRFTHLSADDHGLIDIHGVSLLVALLVAFLLAMHVVWRLNSQSSNHSVHIAVLWVGAAATLDATSTILELIHLSYYQENGIGVYFLDALSAHMESCCDAALMIFLLSIAAGWTLPSSVVNVASSSRNANPIQRVVAGLAHPISNSLQGPSGIFAGSVIGLHVILAQWGRIYDDDFESYHHLEHFPGKILMWIRVLTGLVFVAAVQQILRTGSVPANLKKFYNVFMIAGLFWFTSLPVWTWICNWMIPYHLKRPFVFCGTALLQSASLVVLAWLVTSQSTAYHKYSRITANRETLSDSLMSSSSERAMDVAPLGSQESLTPLSPKAWMLGKKAKVRLD
jgi:Rhodopsin-like GPCR transmembrane domain